MAMVAAMAFALLASMAPAMAACPTSGTTVTCSNSMTNAVDGFGDCTQTGLTINVQPGASVTGTGNDGLNLDDANTVNNAGTITGDSAGISAIGAVTVNNASTGVVSSGSGGTAIAAGTANVTNFGTITGGSSGTGIGANTVGVLGQERLGSTTINTVLIGQNLSFAAPGQNNVGGAYAGLGFDYRMSQLISLFTKVEGTVMTDNSVTGIAQGGVRVSLN